MSSEVLSQDEIDALLSALSKGEVDAESLRQEQIQKKIRVYDFRRPNKFSKDQAHTLQVIFENYARSLSTYLSAQLRSLVQVDVLSVEQLTYEEFVRSLPNPSILCIFAMPPLEGSAIFDINPNLGFAILDRLLGGVGEPLERVRALTEIEETVIEKFAQRMLAYLEEPWSGIVNMEPVLDHIESNPQFVQIVSPSEMVVIISLESKIGDVLGIFNICIPYLVLEPIIDKLSARYYYATSTKDRPGEHLPLIKSQLENAVVPVKAVVGRTSVTVRELLGISVGDVVALERSLQDEFEVVIGHKTKFYGIPGTQGNRMAVKVARVLSEEDENA
jgi:flagellar motor switch protein FliM